MRDTGFFSECKVIIHVSLINLFIQAQPAITCSKLTIEIPEQGVKYVRS